MFGFAFHIMGRRLAKWGVFASLALIGGVLSFLAIPNSPRMNAVEKGGFVLKYPTSVQDLVDRSDIVISATVMSRSFLGWTTKGYSGPGNTLLIEAPDHLAILATPYVEITAETENGNEVIRIPNNSRRWVPFSAYTVRITYIHKSNGDVAIDHDIVVHRKGLLDRGTSGYEHADVAPPWVIGDSFLLTLNRAPDGVNYQTPFSGASCLVLGGGPGTGSDKVYENWNTRVLVGFTSNTNISAFLTELAGAVQ